MARRGIVLAVLGAWLAGCAPAATTVDSTAPAPTTAYDRGWAAYKRCARAGITLNRIEPNGRVVVRHVSAEVYRDWKECFDAALESEAMRCVPGGRPAYALTSAAFVGAIGCGEGRAFVAYHERQAAALETEGKLLIAGRHRRFAGHAARRLGDYDHAVAAYRDALRLFEAAGASGEMVGAFEGLGIAYTQLANFDDARRELDRGRQVADRFTKSRLFWRGAFSVGLAELEYARGNARATLASADDAIADLTRHLEQRLSLADRQSATRYLIGAYKIAGSAHRRLGAREAALTAYRKGLALAEHMPQYKARILEGLGWLALETREPSRGTRYFEDGLTAAARVDAPELKMWLQQGLARSHAQQGRTDDALAAIGRAMDIVENLRSGLKDVEFRTGYVERKQGIYHDGVRIATASGDTGRAFGFAERARARAFLDLLGTQVLAKGRTADAADDEQRVRRRLAEVESAATAEAAETDGASADTEAPLPSRVRAIAAVEYRGLVERVRMENPEQAALMTVEPMTAGEVQALLPDDTTLLEFLVTDNEIFLWAIDRQRIESKRLGVKRTNLVRDVRELRRAIAGSAPIAEVERRATGLYETLIAPARPLIRGTRLLVVPNDVLHYLPFAALRSPEGRWLVEDYTIAGLPSASVLKFLARKGARASGRALVVGNPALGPGLGLPWAEREARAVGGAHPAATVLVGARATETAVKRLARDAGLLHFATHGLLREDDPLGSALLLTPDDQEDGRLEVREIFRLDLDARLVVLSACETGLGKLSKGDELLGLQRAFLYAGTPAVVTTLWKVDDRATYELMETFYAALAGQGPADALRAAQRATLRRYPHPFAWASFGLTGAAFGRGGTP